MPAAYNLDGGGMGRSSSTFPWTGSSWPWDVTMGPELRFGTPTPLFQTRMSLSGTRLDGVLRDHVTRDGKGILINSEPESAETTSAPITVVLNWMAMFKSD